MVGFKKFFTKENIISVTKSILHEICEHGARLSSLAEARVVKKMDTRCIRLWPT